MTGIKLPSKNKQVLEYAQDHILEMSWGPKTLDQYTKKFIYSSKIAAQE